ncbi:MAG: DNA-methyltransferase, partial [Acidimicrobiales bacterium]
AWSEQGNARRRPPTATSPFGSGRREGHDASAFYERFVPPEVSDDSRVARPSELDVIYERDARDMQPVESRSVALVVTSPPYFAGKEYEQVLGRGGVPGSYFEYLALLRAVFTECTRVLEPGGRIAVNVANLGRRPYRSLAGDVASILSDLGLLLRGEVVWWKGRAAGGSCAWGSFQSPANPVLRDVTERVVIASKGRFDRALTSPARRRGGLPFAATITRDEFLEATTDLWEIAPERATRVGHPAPFPVELPARLIELNPYAGDVVLDPFMGSGSTAVAAVRAGRHYIGFENDPAYARLARARVAAGGGPGPAPRPQVEARPHFGRAVAEGRMAKEVAAAALADSGFARVAPEVKIAGTGLAADFLATDQLGGQWAFEVSGGFTTVRGGLRRADVLWRALGRAAVLHQARPDLRVVLLTTDCPRSGAGAAALRAVTG